MATRKKAKASGVQFIPTQRWVWMDYFDPDDPESPPIQVEVRRDLTFGESDSLSFDKDANPPMTEIWDKLAPFVRDWNFADDKGAALPAPAEAGGAQFNYMPLPVFWKVWSDLKWRSSGTVDSKRSGGSGKSAEPASVAISRSEE